MDEKMKVLMNASPWAPLTIVKGGQVGMRWALSWFKPRDVENQSSSPPQAANFLVKALESPWGRKLYAKTLLKNIGQAVYRVCVCK